MDVKCMHYAPTAVLDFDTSMHTVSELHDETLHRVNACMCQHPVVVK
jgi:hypothetical protein